MSSALLALPFSVGFSRYRPVPLVLVSLLLGLPFLVLHGMAQTFFVLLLARFCFVVCHVIATPARPLLLQQWIAPSQYALVQAVGLSLHSTLLAVTISTSALLIGIVGSWQVAYLVLAGFFALQTIGSGDHREICAFERGANQVNQFGVVIDDEDAFSLIH